MRKIVAFLFLCVLILPLSRVTAQDDADVCSPDAIRSRTDEIYRVYAITSTVDKDIESALRTLEHLQTSLDELHKACSLHLAETLLANLETGGFVVYMRHAATDVTQTDSDLSSCETQRNLSDQGREDAQHIGEYFATLNIPISRLISTEYCRTRETAQMAFGEPEIIDRVTLTGMLPELLSTPPPAGTNTFIVAHIGVIAPYMPQTTTFEEGDALIYLPKGDDGFELIERIPLAYWELFAEIQEAR
jgi:hypothetical protein